MNIYNTELLSTVNKLCEKGKGILAADESINTIGKRFSSINVENTEENRTKYRELLFSTPELNKYISGVIVFSETLENKRLVNYLTDQNILVGIKTDIGLESINSNNEKVTKGLDNLAEISKKYYDLGARFAKWRIVINIDENKPSDLAISLNSQILAVYALISQNNGLVPIVEPEVIMDGNNSIEVSEKITREVLSSVFRELIKHNVQLDKIILKPNMVRSGSKVTENINYSQISKLTIKVLQDTVPVSVPGIFFLSGGMREEEATQALNIINQSSGKKPWYISFSYGRALQQSVLKMWSGNDENVKDAQNKLLEKARNNSLATVGEYIDNIV